MKYFVDAALCCGHARCEAAAPEVFQTDDDGMNVAVGREVEIAPEHAEAARAASDRCPEAAIRVYE